MAAMWFKTIFLVLILSFVREGLSHEGELHDYIGGSSTAEPLIKKLLGSQKAIPNKYVLSNSAGSLSFSFEDENIHISLTFVTFVDIQVESQV